MDEIAATELKLFIDNDADLYRQRFIPIIKNLSRKRYNGTYDSQKAIKLFMYLVDDGAKKYSKDFGGHFDKQTRLETARLLRNDFEAEFESGNYYEYKQKYRVALEKKPVKVSSYLRG